MASTAAYKPTALAKNVNELRDRFKKQVDDERKQRRANQVMMKRMKVDAEDVHAVDYLAALPENLLILASSRDRVVTLTAARFLRQALSHGGAAVANAVISDPQHIQSLVNLLATHDSELQLEAAWCVTNIAAGSHEQAVAVLPASPHLIGYLSTPDSFLQDQAAWAIGNLAGDSPECRSVLRAQGALRPLVGLLQSNKDTVVISAAFAVSNLCRGKDANADEIVSTNCSQIVCDRLQRLLQPTVDVDPRLVAELGWVLAYTTSTHFHLDLNALIDLDVAGSVVKLLTICCDRSFDMNGADTEWQLPLTPFIRTMGNLICFPSSDRPLRSLFHQSSFFDTLHRLLHHELRHVLLESSWCLSNLFASPEDLALSLIESGFLTDLVDLLESGFFDVQKEAGYAALNLAARGPQFVALLEDLVQGLMSLLRISDPEMQWIGIRFADMILRSSEDAARWMIEADGIDALETLQFHENDELRAAACGIVDEFFGEDF